MSNSTSKVVRALDLGWGYTKFSTKNVVDGEMEFHSFPSLAPRHTGMDLSMSLLGKRDTTVVNVDGTKYEVGPDSADLDVSDASRSLNDSFIHTEQYKAVFYGALHYIGESEIDLLVVGLPLNGMNNAAKLKEMVVGTHKISDTETVVVKDALVLPQPLGGLYYCFSLKDQHPELEFIEEDSSLVIDPGFLTFDFLLTNGEKVVDNRSGAHTGGVSKVLRSIAESISTKFGIKYENLGAIDKGLRRRKLKINGEVEALEEHIKNTRAVLEAPVNMMKNYTGPGTDIDLLVLLGGGAGIFEKTIRHFYPKHPVFVVPESQTANVRGYQLAGERYLTAQK